MNKITRRELLKGTAASVAGIALMDSPIQGAPSQLRRAPPNLLFLHTDQQHYQALSAAGNKWVHTPNMDRLINRGVAFSLSYSPNPVCCPARSAWYTGRPPSRNGMLSNAHKLDPDLPDLGQWFGSRGYHPFYTGKWHIPGRNVMNSFTSLAAEATGIGEHADSLVSRTAQSFLAGYNGDKPFFLSVSFLQPHDCCYWVFARPGDIEKLPDGLTEHNLPPLPENFDQITDEPPAMREHMTQLRKQVERWSPLQWRYYIWSYYRMVEMADAEIGRVIDALDSSRFASDTLIVFTSDHGDGLARRKMVQKWRLYDEAARVPLVIVPPGGCKSKLDKRHVVSGLDIPATLCDYAGIAPIPGCAGSSLRPLVEDNPIDWRGFAVAEANLTGRMIRTPQYKLISYKDESPELLFDMRRDPWEVQNLAEESKYAGIVSDLRAELANWEKSQESWMKKHDSRQS